MKTGDLVRWTPHTKWQHGGLGTIVEIGDRIANRGQGYRIMWHMDIEDIRDYKGGWYTNADFEDGKIVKV